MSTCVRYAGQSYTYLLDSVTKDHGRPAAGSPMTRYYSAHGTPPGTWLGAGLAGIADDHGLAEGSFVTPVQMERLFANGEDPATGAALGRSPHVYADGDPRRPVAGFDFTFTSPSRSACSGRWLTRRPVKRSTPATARRSPTSSRWSNATSPRRGSAPTESPRWMLAAWSRRRSTTGTVTGLLIAYLKARRDKQPLDRLKKEVDELGETDLAELWTAGAGSDVEAGNARAEADRLMQDLEHAKQRAGVEGSGPTLTELGLPLSYFARHSALTDAVASFRTGGTIAIVGIVISTVASVWSLYLPA